jgi:hypothetical protein
LPLGAVTAFLTIVLPIPEQTAKGKPLSVLSQLHHHLDLLGFVLFAPAVIQLLLALQYGGNDFAWNSSQVIGLFCGAAATFAAWLLWNNRRGDAALLPPGMIRRRTVWSASLFNAFQMVGIYGLFYYLPVYFQAVYNASAILSGVYIIPMILPQLLAAGLTGGVCKLIRGEGCGAGPGGRISADGRRRCSAEDGIRDPNRHLFAHPFLSRNGSDVDIASGQLGGEMGRLSDPGWRRLGSRIAAGL